MPVIGAYGWMPHRELCILTEVSQAEAFASIFALPAAGPAVRAAMVLLMVLLDLLFARTVIRRVRQLAKGARRIGQSRVKYRIWMAARDEIGRFTGAFNKMATDLVRPLGEAACGQCMLLALSQAAQGVQRAHTPDEVYHAVGDEVARLGYHAMLFILADDRAHLHIPYMAHEPSALRVVEELIGRSVQGYCFPMVPGGFYERIISETETTFTQGTTEHIAEALPRPLRSVAGRVASLMGLEGSIVAPLTVGGETHGLLGVTGAGLSEADVPAVTAFANQTAIALENAQARQELRKDRDHLGELAEQRAAELRRANERLEAEIAERRRTQEALNEYSERLEEMVEQRTKELQEAQEQLVRREKLTVLAGLAGGVGHELRNPLGAIKNAAYFLNMALEEPEPEVRETLEILEEEVGACDKIIGGLLDFAQPKPLILRNVHINDVVQEALRCAIVPQEVEVVTQLEALPTVLADPEQLGQVFGNIIHNAIQAMPEGGRLLVKTLASPRPEDSGEFRRALEPSQAPEPEWVAVSFTDAGVGISQENLGKVFEPLFTTKAKGIGLGLAVTRTLVEAHGGTITASSEVGKGSTFTVRLPLTAPHSSPFPLHGQSEGASVERG